ncbi:Thioesterase superfamily protein [Euphorbia peplus]|nr:Thioesterase superfamily protein [Euphorbia peplus]
MKDEDARVKKSITWLERKSKEAHELEALSLHGLKVVEARQGYLLCNFVISDRASDENGNWEAGAVATLIDDVGFFAIYSMDGHMKVSLDFSISYFSPAKIHEEVEIEAKVVGEKGKLMSVLTEIRKKNSGQLIALGKQWMASNSIANSAELSKL